MSARLRLVLRRLMAPAVVVVALTAAAAVSAREVPGPTSAAASVPPAQARVKAGRLTLRNTTSDTLRIEVRIGAAASCEGNKASEVRALPPGRRWVIASNKPMCWRRAPRTTGNAQNPQQWHRHALTPGQRAEVTP